MGGSVLRQAQDDGWGAQDDGWGARMKSIKMRLPCPAPPGSFDYLRIPRHSRRDGNPEHIRIPTPFYFCRHGNLESIWIPTPRHSRRNGNPESIWIPTPLYSCRHGNLESIWIPTLRHSRRNGNPEPFSPSTLVRVCRNVPVGTSTCLHGAA